MSPPEKPAGLAASGEGSGAIARAWANAPVFTGRTAAFRIRAVS
jgi:hypothetical protein